MTALNEELVDRLRLLNYERDYVRGYSYGNVGVISQSLQQLFPSPPTPPINSTPSKSNGSIQLSLIKYLFQLNDVQADYSKFD